MAATDLLSEAEGLEVVAGPGVDTSILAATIEAVSGRIDVLAGPVVQRDVTDERHVDTAGCPSLELRSWPVVDIDSCAEYDSGGSSTTLLEETVDTKPGDAFRLDPIRTEADLGLFGPMLRRRSSGRVATFADEVLVSYTAGRFANTAAVEERYKEAARITLASLWRRIAMGVGKVDEYDVPIYPFPGFAVPNAARGLLSDVAQDVEAGLVGLA